MNPYYYLFYRLNQFFNKENNNEWGPIFGISVFLGWNLVIVYITILPITEANYNGAFKTIFIIILALIFLVNSILFLNKKRLKEIMDYSNKESKSARKLYGSYIIIYILISFGLIFYI
ncbi:MAG: hypothetical protein CL530_03810 [Aequorivita sp.]|nr:hypothetical protein [Aequorivita sp.]|tara:strand:+ start:1700 stop:2053 length:354 start_codon:yes stop_codon:yes gene_type:complete